MAPTFGCTAKPPKSVLPNPVCTFQATFSVGDGHDTINVFVLKRKLFVTLANSRANGADSDEDDMITIKFRVPVPRVPLRLYPGKFPKYHKVGPVCTASFLCRRSIHRDNLVFKVGRRQIYNISSLQSNNHSIVHKVCPRHNIRNHYPKW